MAICKSCYKFAVYDTGDEPEVELQVTNVAFDEEEPGEGEEQDELKDGDAEISVTVEGTVRIVLTSECCGDELKEATFDINEAVSVNRAEGCVCNDLSENFEVEGEGFEITERLETTTKRRLKSGEVKETPIKNPRYMRKYYGAEGQIVVTCSCGATKATVDWSDEVQASGMDEL